MIVPTIDGIGEHEMERDMEKGDDLHIKMLRAIERSLIQPSPRNIERAEKLIAELQAYTIKMGEKYNEKVG